MALLPFCLYVSHTLWPQGTVTSREIVARRKGCQLFYGGCEIAVSWK